MFLFLGFYHRRWILNFAEQVGPLQCFQQAKLFHASVQLFYRNPRLR